MSLFFFANLAFLTGLLAMGIPIAIHMLHSTRTEIVPFGTIRFLRLSERKTARGLRIKNMSLLLARMGLIALIVIALAKPIVRISGLSIIGSNVSSSFVIILDNSYSTGYRDEGVSLFNRAKKTAIDIVDTMKEGDEVAIILMNETPDMIFKEFTYDIAAAKEALRNAEISYSTTNVRESLLKAFEMLKNAHNKARREIHILTDLQQNGWESLSQEDILNNADKRIAVYITIFGKEAAENDFIADVDVPSDSASSGAPTNITVKIANDGAAPVEEVVTLSVNGDKKIQRPVTISPALPATIKLPYAFEGSGVHSGKITLNGDQLPIDDSYYFAVSLKKDISVLCVDGDPSDTPTLSETFYLTTALNPAIWARSKPPTTGPMEAQLGSLINPTNVTLSELGSEDLSKYQCVFLCNAPSLGGSDSTKLEQYLNVGGNLVIFLGPRVDAGEYNRWGVVPAKLTDPRGHPNKDAFFNLMDINQQHPIFAKFSVPGSGDLMMPRFFMCYSVDEGSLKDTSRVLARFRNGVPAFIESRYGKGKVLMITTTCDPEWTNLPLRAIYLPLIHQIVYYMSGKSSEAEKYHVGDHVRFESLLSGYERKISITSPSGHLFSITPIAQQDRSVAIFEATDEPGVYMVSTSAAESGSPTRPSDPEDGFAVNLDTKESILQRADGEDIKSRFGNSEIFLVNDPKELIPMLRDSRQGIQLWSKLFFLALVLFIIESLLANKFSHLSSGERKVPLFDYLKLRRPGLS